MNAAPTPRGGSGGSGGSDKPSKKGRALERSTSDSAGAAAATMTIQPQQSPGPGFPPLGAVGGGAVVVGDGLVRNRPNRTRLPYNGRSAPK